MKDAIRELEPSALWGYFYDLTQTPRPSGFMEPVQQFMMKFGQSLKLTTIKDDMGNILIRKPATPGMEKKPPVVLQAHLDMVPQKNNHIAHDFQKDPIKPRIDNGWVKAAETTLGADNGIGAAAIMAVLASDTIEHGPLEGFFTIDEETGMDGAFGVKPDSFQARTLINLDSEHEGDLFVGCAGGINVNVEFRYQKNVPVFDGDVALKLSLTGLKGGHSGVDIHLGRANANKLLFNFLKKAVSDYEIRLASYHGGTLRNAIPRETFAILTLPAENVPALKEGVAAYEKMINESFTSIENRLILTVETSAMPDNLMPEGIQDDLINAMVAVHDGVLRYIPEMPEVVETSSNLAIVDSQEGLVTCQFLARSSSPFMRDNIVSMIQSTCALAGAKVTTSGAYPGWMPDLKSHVMDVMVSAYEQLFNSKPAVNVIHAGLECGIIQDAIGKMEMISFGPNISFPHSPDEKVEIASVERFWKYLLMVLRTI